MNKFCLIVISSRRFILNFHICLILNVSKTSQKNNVILQYAKLFNEQKHMKGYKVSMSRQNSASHWIWTCRERKPAGW